MAFDNGMLSVIVLVCCAAAGVACGVFATNRQKQRKQFLFDAHRYVVELKINVNGRRCLIADFNKEFAATACDAFKEYLTGDKHLTVDNSSDSKTVSKFFEELQGCCSSDLILSCLERYEGIFGALCKKCDDKFKDEHLYVKLGFLLGITIGIILM